MNLATHHLVLVGLAALAGPRCGHPTPVDASTEPPAPGPVVAAAADENVQRRVGYMAEFPMAHPTVSDHDDYLDVFDDTGALKQQLIVVFAPGAPRPADRQVPVELTGAVRRMELGGPPGTPGEYANEVIFVASWKPLRPADVPRARSVAPGPRQ